MSEKTMQINEADGQYVLNINEGAVTVFETVTDYCGIMLIFSRDISLFDDHGNIIKRSVGVQTLLSKPMDDALEQLIELGVEIIKTGHSNNEQ